MIEVPFGDVDVSIRVFQLEEGWEWRVGIKGLIGKANGFAPNRGEALQQALAYIDEELLQQFLVQGE
jgi:hypothetical protein